VSPRDLTSALSSPNPLFAAQMMAALSAMNPLAESFLAPVLGAAIDRKRHKRVRSAALTHTHTQIFIS
jgi:hypothetical protein